MGLLDPEQPKKKARNNWMWSFNYRPRQKDTKKVYHDDHEKMNEEQRLRELNNLKLREEYDEEI
jgi:hypothetical protein